MPVYSELSQTPKQIWVDPSGNDGNLGTQASPLKWIQTAYEKLVDFHHGGNPPEIHLTGIHTKGFKDYGKPIVGAEYKLIGHSASIQATSDDCIEISNGQISVQDVSLQNSNGSCIHSYWRGSVILKNGITFGPTPYEHHIFLDNGGQAIVYNNYTVNGGADHHWHVHSGAFLTCVGRQITLVGNPSFVIFAFARQANIECPDNTFINSAYGIRYYFDVGANVDPGNLDSTQRSTYFPGHLAGSIGNGSTYGGRIGYP